jgi:hypothetical protein
MTLSEKTPLIGSLRTRKEPDDSAAASAKFARRTREGVHKSRCVKLPFSKALKIEFRCAYKFGGIRSNG